MIAIYTHLLAVYMQPCTGLCCLCCSRFKNQEGSRGSRNDNVFCGLCRNNKQLFKDAQQRLRSSSTGSCNTSPSSHALHEKHASANVVIKGDNCCGANHAGLSHFTKDIDTEVNNYCCMDARLTHTRTHAHTLLHTSALIHTSTLTHPPSHPTHTHPPSHPHSHTLYYPTPSIGHLCFI